MDYSNSSLIIETSKVKPGAFAWRSPSNIALIKYWGKHGRQLPRNPSISFTLNQAFTETQLSYEPILGVETSGINLEFLFEGKANEAFEKKLKVYLESLLDIFPFLKQLKLKISSGNSFPHSAGIASSASSMSALALCLCSLEHELHGTLDSDEDYHKKASYIARLGSGSACRSVHSYISVWGKSHAVPGSSDEFGIAYYEDVHDIFKTFQDSILLVSQQEKSVSSTAGHQLMEGNPFAEPRFQQARNRLARLLETMRHYML